jgi:hypothetical protein
VGVHVSFCARWHRVDFVNREFHVVFSPKSLAELAPNLQCVKQHRPVRREDRLLVALAGEAARESASQTAHFPQSLDRKRRCWVLQKLRCTLPLAVHFGCMSAFAPFGEGEKRSIGEFTDLVVSCV